MKKYIRINNETFEVKKTIADFDYSKIASKTLDSCYDRPSYTKERIWDFWSQWFNELGTFYYGIKSYNCMMFTIEGVAYVPELDTDCYIYITKTRQEVYPIELPKL